ncbi:MAG: hypothetical protein NT179_04415 [Nitrospirae bacterium]|nr:hypothetical protein [Nitrospirota bacterium]
MTLSLDRPSQLLCYQVSGITLGSDVPLLELAPTEGLNPADGWDIRVRFLPESTQSLCPSSWFLTMALPGEEPWLSCADIEEQALLGGKPGYLLRLHDLADFLVDRQGTDVVALASHETPPETLHHILLNQVLPLVLNLRGQDALHATAVLTPQGICAFAGPAGVGKSTLAASFLLAGYPVISDDCLVLKEQEGRIVAVPGYPGLRLWDDVAQSLSLDPGHLSSVAHYTAKHRLLLPNQSQAFPTEPLPLTRLYILSPPEAPEARNKAAAISLRPFQPRHAFMELLSCLFRLDIRDKTMLARQFCFIERLVDQVPVKQLSIPQTVSALPAVRDAILADLLHEI